MIKQKRTLLSRISIEDSPETEINKSDDKAYNHQKQRTIMKNLHSLKDVVAHINSFPTFVPPEHTHSPKSVVNKDFHQKNACEKLIKWIENQEYDYQFN
jgi:hypothetical protein